jgi:hypothetical protein
MRAAGLKPRPRRAPKAGRIPDNLLAFPDPELAAQRQAELLAWQVAARAHAALAGPGRSA